jgi:hypothetical protein
VLSEEHFAFMSRIKLNWNVVEHNRKIGAWKLLTNGGIEPTTSSLQIL